ncbi:hypothetical protein [Flagellimonas onchidii]|uniref:hypothetical protein n=1 Tax=Flagellimonas onchidii TaxID=2562684 RepID=UPI0010A60BAE|nr:hypothetical protein [Allomuricauda onchidii]
MEYIQMDIKSFTASKDEGKIIEQILKEKGIIYSKTIVKSSWGEKNCPRFYFRENFSWEKSIITTLLVATI